MRHAPLRITAAAVLAAASLSAGAGAAQAKGGNDREVRRSGRCTAGTTWKLKTKPDDGRLEVEVEIDSNRSGPDLDGGDGRQRHPRLPRHPHDGRPERLVRGRAADRQPGRDGTGSKPSPATRPQRRACAGSLVF